MPARGAIFGCILLAGCLFDRGWQSCTGPITCGSGMCTVSCGVGACTGAISCASSCGCSVFCDWSACAGGVTCPATCPTGCMPGSCGC